MREKIEMIKGEIEDVLTKHLRDVSISDDTIATKALREIQAVLKSGNIVDGNRNDFEIVEEIVGIFEKYEIMRADATIFSKTTKRQSVFPR